MTVRSRRSHPFASLIESELARYGHRGVGDMPGQCVEGTVVEAKDRTRRADGRHHNAAVIVDGGGGTADILGPLLVVDRVAATPHPDELVKECRDGGDGVVRPACHGVLGENLAHLSLRSVSQQRFAQCGTVDGVARAGGRLDADLALPMYDGEVYHLAIGQDSEAGRLPTVVGQTLQDGLGRGAERELPHVDTAHFEGYHSKNSGPVYWGHEVGVP